MSQVLEIAMFVAHGAAWGLLWICGLGLFKRLFHHPELTRLLVLIFALAGTVAAAVALTMIYKDYSSSGDWEKEAYEIRYLGKYWYVYWGKIAIVLLPIIFWLKRLRTSRMLIATVALLYVLYPHYDVIVTKISQL